jgi:DNA polymerase III subunit epsilon
VYAIIDIETTGGREQDKITEIAIIIHSGQKVVEEYTTLINPEMTIPYFITKLTGISNEMVEDAPKFYEVAKKIVELTQNKLFVAHNVSFDYNFVKKEFKNLGFEYKRDTLCTVKLARKIISGHKSYSLGNICEDLGINITGRHRALGDATATAVLFEHLLSLSQPKESLFAENDLKTMVGSGPIEIEKIKNLPEETGVYYFYNTDRNLIYIGKSNNIYKRVLSHLSNPAMRAGRMRDLMADISYELTGSELVALLLEDEEIKTHQPPFNRAQRRTGSMFGLYDYFDAEGYHCLKISKNDGDELPFTTFDNKEKAVTFLANLVDKYQLCQKLCGLYQNEGACFHYSVRQCVGACCGEEPVETYNKRVSLALSYYTFDHDSFLIIDKGRRKDEKSIVAVQNGKYLGFGFADISVSQGVDGLLDCIRHREDNKAVHQIILRYLRHNKVERIIRFDH